MLQGQDSACLLYGTQLVDLGLCLRFERGGGQNPDATIAEFDGGRATTERDDPEPAERSAVGGGTRERS